MGALFSFSGRGLEEGCGYFERIATSARNKPVATIVKTAATASIIFGLLDLVSFILPIPLITPLATRFVSALTVGIGGATIFLCISNIKDQFVARVNEEINKIEQILNQIRAQ